MNNESKINCDVLLKTFEWVQENRELDISAIKSNAGIISELTALDTETITHFVSMLLKENNLLDNAPGSATTKHMITNELKRHGLLLACTNDDLMNELKKKEEQNYTLRDKYLTESMAIRDLNKEYSFHQNLYKAYFGDTENKLDQLDFKIRLFLLAFQLKDMSPSNAKMILKKAFEQIQDQLNALKKEHDELKKNRLIHNRMLLIQNTPTVFANGDSIKELKKFKRKAFKKYSNVLLYDVNLKNEPLNPHLQKKITALQQEFIEFIELRELIVKKASIFSQETSEEELEELYYRANQVLALSGTTLTDEYQVLNYDEPTPAEMIKKISRLSSHLEKKISEVLHKGSSMFCNEDYRKWVSTNDLPDEGKEELLGEMTENLAEKKSQFAELKASYYVSFK